MIKILLIFLLSSCNFFNEMKYKYYLHENGEVLCNIMENSPHSLEGKQIRIKNLNTDHPDIILNDRTVGLSKMIEKPEFINAQNLDKINGTTSILVFDKINGVIQYLEIGINNGEISNINYFANCK